METIYVPNEDDFKLWIKDAIREYFEGAKINQHSVDENVEPLISRKEIAQFLNISLVTLHDWMKRGLPSHKQRGKVYFMKSEVLEYIKNRQV